QVVTDRGRWAPERFSICRQRVGLARLAAKGQVLDGLDDGRRIEMVLAIGAVARETLIREAIARRQVGGAPGAAQRALGAVRERDGAGPRGRGREAALRDP